MVLFTGRPVSTRAQVETDIATAEMSAHLAVGKDSKTYGALDADLTTLEQDLISRNDVAAEAGFNRVQADCQKVP